MTLFIRNCGGIVCVYAEAIALETLGELQISRASHVEPGDAGRWTADLSPMLGPVLGPFDLRSEAVTAEEQWLQDKLAEASWPLPSSDFNRGVSYAHHRDCPHSRDPDSLRRLLGSRSSHSHAVTGGSS